MILIIILSGLGKLFSAILIVTFMNLIIKMNAFKKLIITEMIITECEIEMINNMKSFNLNMLSLGNLFIIKSLSYYKLQY
jgi:hypothetical protein